MGQKGTPEYSIEIKKVIDGGDKAYVQVEESYSPGEVSLPVVAIPYHFVKTQKLTKPVEFSFFNRVVLSNNNLKTHAEVKK